jgi:hypothetical protein
MKTVVVKVDKIETVYIGSIYQDIYREIPSSTYFGDRSELKIGHTLTEPVFMEYFLQRNGLHELLSDLEFDFIITDTAVHGQEYFNIPKSMGYAIKNYQGIRFAIVCKDKDTLTIEDEVELSLIRERSDVLWVIDTKLLDLDPTAITFYINKRALSDTGMLPIKENIDTARISKIEKELSRKVHVAGRLDDHLFSTVAKTEGVDMIIYPESLFQRIIEADTMSLLELMHNVAFEMRFKKTEMNDEDILEVCMEKGYTKWGSVKESNIVLVVDETEGRHIFDYYYWKE